MKLFGRWGTVLGLVGSILIGPSLGNLQALALPEEQILQKLRPVPIFTVTDGKGLPLVATVPNEGGKGNTLVAPVFINRADAQSFMDGFKAKNPELGKSIQVMPASLGEIYQLYQSNRNKPERIEFQFIPEQQQVNSAITLLQQGGQQVKDFKGVPLFIARVKQDKGYLSIQRGDQKFVPIFFSKEDLQAALSQFQKQQPDLASSIEIQVVELGGIIDTLQRSNDQQLAQIELVPPRASIEFVQQMRNQQGGQARPAGK